MEMIPTKILRMIISTIAEGMEEIEDQEMLKLVIHVERPATSPEIAQRDVKAGEVVVEEHVINAEKKDILLENVKVMVVVMKEEVMEEEEVEIVVLAINVDRKDIFHETALLVVMVMEVAVVEVVALVINAAERVIFPVTVLNLVTGVVVVVGETAINVVGKVISQEIVLIMVMVAIEAVTEEEAVVDV
jgi:hypothetical protein